MDSFKIKKNSKKKIGYLKPFLNFVSRIFKFIANKSNLRSMSRSQVVSTPIDRSTKKSVQVINYLTSKEKGSEINRLKLMKLLWLADKYHLLKYGRTILKDKYCALEHGPAPSKTKDISEDKLHQDYVGSFITTSQYDVKSIKEVDKVFFSKSDIEVLDAVWDKFGKMDKYLLRDISHEYPEWKRFEKELKNPFTPKSYPMEMLDFFDIPEKNEQNRSEFFNIDKNMIYESIQTFNLRKKFE